MINRDPIETGLKILLHLPHQVAREASEIGHFIGIFWRHDEAELMPILTAPLNKGLAVRLAIESRIGFPLLALPVHSIPLEISKMGIDCLARSPGPLGTTRSLLPCRGIKLDDPRLDGDTTRPEAAAGIPLPTTVMTFPQE